MNLTSSAVTGSPLWNSTPFRSVKSYTRPSGDTFHDSARLGVNLLSGIAFAMPSCTAYITMNGVMRLSISPGSKYFGVSVMCTPHVSCPSGEAAAGVATSPATSNAASAIARWKP